MEVIFSHLEIMTSAHVAARAFNFNVAHNCHSNERVRSRNASPRRDLREF
jgi:hypothetical protein